MKKDVQAAPAVCHHHHDGKYLRAGNSGRVPLGGDGTRVSPRPMIHRC
jgi:hypothetical protein